jgi:hypothetical protein
VVWDHVGGAGRKGREGRVLEFVSESRSEERIMR